MTNDDEPEPETYTRDASAIMLEGAERVRDIVNGPVRYGLDGTPYIRHDTPGEW